MPSVTAVLSATRAPPPGVSVAGSPTTAPPAPGTVCPPERYQVRSDVAAESLARLVIAAFDGLQLQWLYDKKVDMAGGLTELVDVLLDPAKP